MANLIDKTFFILELDIPTNNVNVETTLNAFITQKQKEFLIGIFGGKAMHDSFVAGLLANVQRWKDLRDGSGDYLGFVDGVAKTSPIVNYTFYWWLRKDNTQNTGIGVVKTKGENSSKASPNEKLFHTMHPLRLWYENFYAFVNNVDVYPEFNKIASVRWFDDNCTGINPISI